MIYVDEMMPCLKSHRWPYTEACHLFCDAGELAKLHAFARDLGLKREWFQDHRELPHYDLVRTRRAAALEMGATAASRNQTVVKMREWREHRKPASVQAEFL